MTENKLDFAKEIQEMTDLINILLKLKDTKIIVSAGYRHKMISNLAYDSLEYAEAEEKALEKQVEAFQLAAEIEQKQLVLGELKQRAEEDQKQTELFLKDAKISIDDRIKLAKKLSEDERVPKDVREKLRSRFVLPYNNRYKLEGFNKDDKEVNDQMLVAFFKALIQLNEVAIGWTIQKK